MKKVKSEPDWKQFGQFVSLVVTLFTTVRDTLDAMGVGVAEALAWAVGPGKKVFSDDFVRPLGERILAARPKPVITSITVDLGAFPKLPFDGAAVLVHNGSGIVTLERRADGLYLDGRKLVLTQLPRQRQPGLYPTGHQVREALSDQSVLNANTLDALYDHPELIPDDWKVDEQGIIYFWDTIYRIDTLSYVRSLFFVAGRWYRDYRWLDSSWRERYWAVRS